MLRSVLMAIVIFTGADIVMFDGKHSTAATRMFDQMQVYFGMK